MGFKPGTARWNAQTNPLSYAGPFSIEFYPWLYSNRGPLLMAMTALPTEPQPHSIEIKPYLGITMLWKGLLRKRKITVTSLCLISDSPNGILGSYGACLVEEDEQHDMTNKWRFGRGPWSSSYGRRLMFWRSWVQIPAPFTGCSFFHIDLL